MKNRDQIRQPNHVSTARYTLSVMEMNIMYIIVDELQKKMNKDFDGDYTEEHITIELNRVDKNNNYSRVKEAVKSLMIKSVEFAYNIPRTGKIKEHSTNIVSGYDHVRKSMYITLDIPSKVSKFLCYIGGGYTSFQKTIAISLNSIYSKKLYEMCCRWSDKGGFYSSSIEQFKDYLNISNKYNKVNHLKIKVLDTAKKELEEKADLYFTYTLKKVGRKYDGISMKIHRNVKVNEQFIGVKQKTYSSVYHFLSRFFPSYIDGAALLYTDNIASYGTLEIASDRFNRLDDEIAIGRKTKDDVKNLLAKVILPELGAMKNSKSTKTTQLKLSGF